MAETLALSESKERQISDLYASPNGDRWLLKRRPDGELVVCHYPNQASGGAFLETDVDVFLRQKSYGPEHQALVTVLATLDQSSEDPSDPYAIGELNAALGQGGAPLEFAFPRNTT
jgi:hypothetical protein